MPGSQDRLAEQEHTPDSARPPQAHPDGARLRERMERLPPGHPSSPYDDDGSRRPPVPDLSGRELPLPADPGKRVAERQAGDSGDGHPGELAEDKARIAPDGSWDWKGRHLTPEQSRIADQTLARCLAAEGRDSDGNYGEHGLTPAMRRIEAQLEHGHLADRTEEFALKSPDRFKEKLAREISDEPGSDILEISSRINDAVRYTFIFDDQEYSTAVMTTCNFLAHEGYELYERKNAWANETKSYKGVNSSWMDQEHGMLFEVQVHTPDSWEAKQASHKAYEVIEAPSSTPEERTIAHENQEQIFAALPVPLGAREIASYRKEGW